MLLKVLNLYIIFLLFKYFLQPFETDYINYVLSGVSAGIFCVIIRRIRCNFQI